MRILPFYLRHYLAFHHISTILIWLAVFKAGNIDVVGLHSLPLQVLFLTACYFATEYILRYLKMKECVELELMKIQTQTKSQTQTDKKD
jgi:hypothetical protein